MSGRRLIWRRTYASQSLRGTTTLARRQIRALSSSRFQPSPSRSNKCYQLCLRSAPNRAKVVVPRGGNCPEAIQPPHSSADRATSHGPSTSARVCRAHANSRSVRVPSWNTSLDLTTNVNCGWYFRWKRERGLTSRDTTLRYFRLVPRGGTGVNCERHFFDARRNWYLRSIWFNERSGSKGGHSVIRVI